jgi:hypothetical protein
LLSEECEKAPSSAKRPEQFVDLAVMASCRASVGVACARDVLLLLLFD